MNTKINTMIWKTNHLKIICLEQQGCFPYCFVYSLEDMRDLNLPILAHVATRTWQAPSLQSTRSNTRALQPPLGWGYVLLGVAKSHEDMYMCILGGFLSHGGSPVVTVAFNTHMVIHDLDDLGVTP